jgi:hypothetical protein
MHASGDGHGPSLRPEIAPPHGCRAAAFSFGGIAVILEVFR